MTMLRLVVLSVALWLTGCTATAPFATYPLQPKTGVVDARVRVAICYSALMTSVEKVQELAQAECIGDAVAERIDTDYRLDNCPLSVPGRATFVCTPTKK